jgi:two-component system, chemotaxis family, CheB/CheR fusion protein
MRPNCFGDPMMAQESSEPQTDQLRQELMSARERLQAMTGEHERALEALRNANEELQTVNEELRSTNVELVSAKQVIQSINDELHVVNARLSEKVNALDRASSDLRNLLASTDVATVFLDSDLMIRSFTPALGSIYNLVASDHGRSLTDIVCQLAYDDLVDDVSRVLETLQPLERRVTRRDGRTHYIMRILPYSTLDSTVSGVTITFVNVTGMVQAEQHQRLLVDEMNHRVKNMLTVVGSLAAQTVRRSETLDDFAKAFSGRVRALTTSYTLLSRQNWVSILLQDLLVAAITPYAAQDRSNVVLAGPGVQLKPAGALAMGMAIHELASNAFRHGSLSVPKGAVNIAWRLERSDDGSELVIDWTERNGPPVQSSPRRGFGATLIERGFAHELSGRAKLAFETTGVRATLRAPFRVVVYDETLSERSPQ